MTRDEALGHLLHRFLASRRSPHTRDAYQRDLTLWFTWCANNGADVMNARHAEMLGWLAHRRDHHDAEATLARRLSAVSKWYQWLIREHGHVPNPTTLLPEERPHGDKYSATIALSPTQTEQLLAAADNDSPRCSAAVALLAYTGIRVGELTAATVDHVTLQRGQPVLEVMGKGRRRRTVPLPAPAYERLDAYWRTRTPNLLPALTASGGTQPLITTSTGGQYTRRQMLRDLKRLARKAGGDLSVIADRISPHCLRHSYATDLLDAGVPLRDVQYAMGHKMPETTERYDHGRLSLERHPTYQRAAQLRSSARSDTEPAPEVAP
jgi:integrase/recombinase XerD